MKWGLTGIYASSNEALKTPDERIQEAIAKRKENEIKKTYGVNPDELLAKAKQQAPQVGEQKTYIRSVMMNRLPYYLAQRPDIPEIATMPLLQAIFFVLNNDSHLFMPCWGYKGAGKSTFILWFLKAVYKSWDKALYYFVHTLNEFEEKVDKAGYVPMIAWDDMVVHFGKWTSYVKGSTKEFSELFDAIRTEVGVFMPTMVNPANIVSAIRVAYMGEIFMPRRGLGLVETYVWKVDAYRMGQIYGRKYLTDVVFVKNALPEEVQKKIMVKRKGLLQMKKSNLRLALTEEALKQISKFTVQDKNFGKTLLVEALTKPIFIESAKGKRAEVTYMLAGCGMLYEDRIGTYRTTEVGRTYLEMLEAESDLKTVQGT